MTLIYLPSLVFAIIVLSFSVREKLNIRTPGTITQHENTQQPGVLLTSRIYGSFFFREVERFVIFPQEREVLYQYCVIFIILVYVFLDFPDEEFYNDSALI
jgi:hypothetical protein